MDHTTVYVFTLLTATLLLGTVSTTFICPNTCHCYETTDHLHAANCTDFEALHKYLLHQKSPKLDVLRVQDAGLTKINGQLDKLSELKVLDLSGNNLKSVKKLPKHLIKLDLSKNILNHIDATELPTGLKVLNLAQNHLVDLPYALTRLKNLHTAKFENNPLSCSCETLHVRDWLARHSIETDKVTCSEEFSDAVPWEKIKSAEACSKKSHDFDYLMQGDDPLAGDVFQGSGFKGIDDEYDEDVFLSVPHVAKPSSTTPVPEDNEGYEASGNGIGDFNFEETEDTPISEETVSEISTTGVSSDESTEAIDKIHMETTTEDDTISEDDGSGSGAGPLIGFDDDNDLDEDEDDDDISWFNQPDTTTEDPSTTSYFADFNLFNWFGSSDDDKNEPEVETTSASSQEVITSEAPVFLDPVVEPEIIKAEAPKQETEMTNHSSKTDNDKEEINVGNVQTAGRDGDNSTTYACLGVLSVLLLILVVYVIFKKRKTEKRRKRQQRRDAENPGTEMRDINRKLMEKPIIKNKINGNSESAPLVSNGEKKNQPGTRIIPATVHNNGDAKEQPVKKPVNVSPMQSQPSPMNGSGQQASEQSKKLENLLDTPSGKQDLPAKKTDDVAPVHPQSSSPVNRDQNELGDAPVYNPIYPNDCKVRIKLKENPESVPKTPVLVTRTRSNAGDIIVTPVNKTDVTNQR